MRERERERKIVEIILGIFNKINDIYVHFNMYRLICKGQKEYFDWLMRNIYSGFGMYSDLSWTLHNSLILSLVLWYQYYKKIMYYMLFHKSLNLLILHVVWNIIPHF